MASARIPVVPGGIAGVDLTDYGREILAPRGIYPVNGLNYGIGRHRPRHPVAGAPRARPGRRGAGRRDPGRHDPGPWSEAQARDLLSSSGVPVVPGELVNSADAAAAAAARLGLPVVLKICSAQITHKSDIGGVALGLDSEAAVRAAYDRVRAAGDGVTGAEIEGVLVLPMRVGRRRAAGRRHRGPDVRAGAGRRPGRGVGGDPPGHEPAAAAGRRGRGPGDARRAAGPAAAAGCPGHRAPPTWMPWPPPSPRWGDTALSLGGALGALEVNPLWVSGDQVEALDVLVVTEPQEH